jgi:hypothetical protein
LAVTEWRVFASEPSINVTVTAQPRCIGGNAYVAVQAHNGESSALGIALETPYGSRNFPSVAPGGNAYQSFPVRASSVPAGTATARVQDTTLTSSYSSLTCS